MLTPAVTSLTSLATSPAVSQGLIAGALRVSLPYLRVCLRRNSASFNNRSPLLNDLSIKRFKSTFSSDLNKPDITIENALFSDLKMSQIELGRYNNGIRMKYLKEMLEEQKLSLEQLERDVMDFKSNFQ